MKTNLGKIASLPEEIRNELNRRIQRNEFGIRLVDWLNSLPEVQVILARDFDGRPINAVNFHKWKSIGYRAWRMIQKRDQAIKLLLTQLNSNQASRRSINPKPMN